MGLTDAIKGKFLCIRGFWAAPDENLALALEGDGEVSASFGELEKAIAKYELAVSLLNTDEAERIAQLHVKIGSMYEKIENHSRASREFFYAGNSLKAKDIDVAKQLWGQAEEYALKSQQFGHASDYCVAIAELEDGKENRDNNEAYDCYIRSVKHLDAFIASLGRPPNSYIIALRTNRQEKVDAFAALLNA